MSVINRIQSGDLCGVRRPLGPPCGNTQEAVAVVPTDRGEVELALCVHHLAELHNSADPIATARGWVA